jgi:hypothetical protein
MILIIVLPYMAAVHVCCCASPRHVHSTIPQASISLLNRKYAKNTRLCSLKYGIYKQEVNKHISLEHLTRNCFKLQVLNKHSCRNICANLITHTWQKILRTQMYVNTWMQSWDGTIKCPLLQTHACKQVTKNNLLLHCSIYQSFKT